MTQEDRQVQIEVKKKRREENKRKRTEEGDDKFDALLESYKSKLLKQLEEARPESGGTM